jgi:hypothetical protein
MLVNLGNKRFADVTAGAGADFHTAGRRRGAAFGDYDGDGRIDVVVSRIGEPAELFRNVTPGSNHWLGLRLRGTRSIGESPFGLGKTNPEGGRFLLPVSSARYFISSMIRNANGVNGTLCVSPFFILSAGISWVRFADESRAAPVSNPELCLGRIAVKFSACAENKMPNLRMTSGD